MVAVQKWFTLIGLAKYGLVLSAILVYLPLTAVFKNLPGANLTGNMFVELQWQGVLLATLFLLAIVWSVMFTEGLIINGHENRFDKHKKAYRRMAKIKTEVPEEQTIPHWADMFFTTPVTGWQFIWFTLVLAGPSLVVIAWFADNLIQAAAMILIGFALDYLLFLVLTAPVALIDPEDPPLTGFPLANTVWRWFGYKANSAPIDTVALRFSNSVHDLISTIIRNLGLSYLIDPKNAKVFPVHVLPIIVSAGIFVLWLAFDSIAYPGRFDIESAPVVYVYASLLLFVWVFAALNFHLGRIHISSIVVVLILVFVGYSLRDIDHEYRVIREVSPLQSLTPVDAAAGSKGGKNLVVIASAGGGIWAAGWTALALEKLIGARKELAREIRLLSTVSGGSVGAAHYIRALLKNKNYLTHGIVDKATLHEIQVKSTASSLEAVAYGIAFRDFPRLLTGGLYDISPDRGYLLEDEWARIASGTVKGNHLDAKGAVNSGKCWVDQKECGFLDLREPIRSGLIPAVIFNSTAMELGQRVMITPLDFGPMSDPSERGKTLTEFLFSKGDSVTSIPRANLPFWTAARLSATFSYVSPAVRTHVDKPSAQDPAIARKYHLVDGGYYDNFGVASALDWLQPVLLARKKGTGDLKFERVLIIQLRGFADFPRKASPGFKSALIGPLDAIFAIREGVAKERNGIDIDRFTAYWNTQLSDKVKICTVEFVPNLTQTAGPLSWHLSGADIANLENSWGDGTDPDKWQTDITKNWKILSDFLSGRSSAACRSAAFSGQAAG